MGAVEEVVLLKSRRASRKEDRVLNSRPLDSRVAPQSPIIGDGEPAAVNGVRCRAPSSKWVADGYFCGSYNFSSQPPSMANVVSLRCDTGVIVAIARGIGGTKLFSYLISISLSRLFNSDKIM